MSCRLGSVTARTLDKGRDATATCRHSRRTRAAGGYYAPIKNLRIAVGGIRHETNTFSTLHTTLDDFTIERGAEIDVGGEEGVEVVGTLQASAFPHGVVARETYETLK